MLIALNACGSDGSDAGTAGSASIAEGNIESTASDYAYLDVPSQLRVGSSLSLVNDSEVEAHELVAVRLPDDESRSTAELGRLPPEELGPLLAEPRMATLAAPNAPGMTVVGDGTLNEPGRYALICLIPTGADPDEYLAAAAASDGPPQVDGGPPHTVEGMFAEITVVE